MNLLKDRWIPVRKGSRFEQISYKDLLCSEHPELQVALPRDDLELACIQMLAAMTQIIFIPKDKKELRERVKTPLLEKEYDEGVEKYKDWFDLDHPKSPFMQTRGIDGKFTSIQKLLPGLPEASSDSDTAHCFFNTIDEVRSLDKGITAIALFNIANGSPSFGGGFMNGLRAYSPIITLIKGNSIRETIWQNVLDKNSIDSIYPWFNAPDVCDAPTWVIPIHEKEEIHAHKIGLLRGLFWQPILIEMVSGNAMCDFQCGEKQNVFIGFKKKKMGYKYISTWPHPYSPRMNDSEHGSNIEPSKSYLTFNSDSPIWTQMNELLFSNQDQNTPGLIMSPVIRQYGDLFPDKKLDLIVGGYLLKKKGQAKIHIRRHELLGLPAQWNSNYCDNLKSIPIVGLAFLDALVESIAIIKVGVGMKKTKNKKNKEKELPRIGEKILIDKTAEREFFHLTEPLIHRMLRENSLQEFIKAKNAFLDDLSRICFDIFDRVTRPYTHKPELIGTVALARVKLNGLLNKLSNEHTVTGGAA